MGGIFSAQQQPKQYIPLNNNLIELRNEQLNMNKRILKKVPQKDVVFMPQPPTGQMPTKMAFKTMDLRPKGSQQQIEANIKHIKKIPELGKVAASVSAAKPMSGTRQE